MRFGAVPLDQALGATLAHAARLPGGVLKKGHLLTAPDLAALAQAGHPTVIVARLDPGDVAEDAAALRLAQALVPDPAGQGIRLGTAATGRVNLYATGPGVIRVDAAAVHAVNAAHPMITLATVAPFHRTDPGAMLATVKIIAWAVPDTALQVACAAAATALVRAAPCLSTATLIETTIPAHDPGPKGRAAIAARLDRLAIRLTPPVRVPHTPPRWPPPSPPRPVRRS